MTGATIPDSDPQSAATLLRALAHPMRLAILSRLLDGEAAVSVFEDELGMRQPNLSQQLAALRDAGLVATRRVSRSIIYRLTDPRVRPLIGALHLALPTRAPPPPPRVAPPAASPGACAMFSNAGWKTWR